jgi:DNA-binding NarL/FixJ family response regulator
MATAHPESAPVRVLVVDDQLSFHHTLHELIDATPGFEWIGGAMSGEEAIQHVARLRPDLVLMDIRMPGMAGLDAARRITSGDVRPRVVLISAGDLPPEPDRGLPAEVVSKSELTPRCLLRLWKPPHERDAPDSRSHP